MKKLILILVLLSISINYVNASTNTANSYVLMDMDSGRVLQSKNKDKQMLIASITNIMTI